MGKAKRHLTYANVMATLAVVIAVAGGSAAIAVTSNAPKNADVTKKGKIKPGHVTAAALAGIDVQTAATKDGSPAKAVCLPGERLLGGGGETTTQNGLIISKPEANAWLAQPVPPASGATTTAYALCLKAAPGA